MRAIVRACGALGVLTLLSSAPVAGQGPVRPPSHGRREIPGLDFSKNGGWRVKSRRIMTTRAAMLARGQLSALNTPGLAQVVEGDLRIPVVFLSYVDTSVADTTAVIGDTTNFRPVFFSTTPQSDVPARPYSLKTFYEQLSDGHLQLDGQMYGWIRTPLTYAQVGANCDAVFCTSSITIHNGIGAFFKAALDSLNSVAHQVDWGQFDNDGPDGAPNSGDDDGVVDFVTFIHPTLGGECNSAAIGHTGNRIWAHRWVLQGALGTMYTTKSSWAGHPGQFIRINDYTVQSARGGNSGCTASQILPIGTVAHETGHTFGIPDLYNTVADSAEGVGEWSLMGSGNYTMSYSPVTWDAWSKLMMGWVSVDSLTTTRTVTLGPVQTSDTVLVAPMGGTNEYLLLENRAYLQSDTAQFNSSAGLHRKMPGLLVWHVDTAVINQYIGFNEVNGHRPEGLHLMQADGRDDLLAGEDRGDMGDPFPGSTVNRSLSPNTSPAARTNDGTPAGFTIDSIYQPDPSGAMVFRFTRDTVPVPIAVSEPQATTAILGGSALTLSQNYYLDQIGNGNGNFDLGDYLAFLRTNGFVVAAPTFERAVPLHSIKPSKGH